MGICLYNRFVTIGGTSLHHGNICRHSHHTQPPQYVTQRPLRLGYDGTAVFTTATIRYRLSAKLHRRCRNHTFQSTPQHRQLPQLQQYHRTLHMHTHIYHIGSTNSNHTTGSILFSLHTHMGYAIQSVTHSATHPADVVGICNATI